MRTTPEFGDAESEAANRLIDLALREDLGEAGDITSRTFLNPATTGRVQIVTRQAGHLAGGPILELVFARIDSRVKVQNLVSDGAILSPGMVVAELSGPVISLLEGERTALNFLTHLSGIATLTARFVETAGSAGTTQGVAPEILDTRKTLPGWRVLEKYAVRAGGGTNHRMGLFDAVLIKDNHLAAWSQTSGEGSLAAAVAAVRKKIPPKMVVEIEVDTLEQLQEVLPGNPDIVLLDNMPPRKMSEAVAMRNAIAPNVRLEASGGVTLERLVEIAASGVERISIGALTHSAPHLDLAFDWKK